MDQKLSGKFALVILAIVIVAGLALVVLNKRAPVVAPAGPAVAPPQPVLTSAPKGETIAGFPKELILDKAAEVGNSYSLSYNENLNQYSASYNSALSMDKLYGQYKSYYEGNGWTITNDIAKYQNSRGLYAVKDTLESSVGIFDEGKTRNVIVNYLKK